MLTKHIPVREVKLGDVIPSMLRGDDTRTVGGIIRKPIELGNHDPDNVEVTFLFKEGGSEVAAITSVIRIADHQVSAASG